MRKINILLMAGHGSRFINYGIKTPKPFILINNKPMFINVIKNTFKPDLWIIVCLKKHVIDNNLEFILKQNQVNNYKLVKLNEVTNGQASSALATKKLLRKNDLISIFPCDAILKLKFLDIKGYLKENDIIVFTRKPSKYNLKNVNQFGWIRSNKNKILNIYCKYLPKIKINHNVIIGVFIFSNKNIMISSIEKMINEKIKINNEYYIDESLKFALHLNYSLFEYITNDFISLGTPQEVKSFSKNSKWT